MKAKIIPIISGFILTLIFISSCEDSTYREYEGNSPVYLSYDNLRSAVVEQENVQLKNPGKIYFKDDYIFIIEELKGFHVFDNSNPASPVKKAFIAVPGAVDMSISGSTMYIDSYIDLVVLDVSDITKIKESGRVKDIFPYTVPPTGNKYPMASIDRNKGVVTDWNLGIVREKVIPPQQYPYPIFWERGYDYITFNSAMGASSGVSGSGVGVGGSMARFGIKGDVLYTVDQNKLSVFSITNKTAPTKNGEFYPTWGIETMFLTDKYMFFGTTTGMVIYDISIPLSPQYKSFYNHVRSCDPVVVDDTLAYVTLRSGTSCGGSTNVLDVVGIKNIAKPMLKASYAMTNPHGLGKDGNLLFICDGAAGLKVYDATDPLQIGSNLIYSYPDIKAIDVIPVGNVLVLIAEDGLYQYNYSNISNITLLSKIEVVAED
jgi:hypothetical protein